MLGLFKYHPVHCRYPDEEAGQVPVAFVVRQNGRFIDESKIKDFIARQVLAKFSCTMMIPEEFKTLFIFYFSSDLPNYFVAGCTIQEITTSDVH